MCPPQPRFCLHPHKQRWLMPLHFLSQDKDTIVQVALCAARVHAVLIRGGALTSSPSQCKAMLSILRVHPF